MSATTMLDLGGLACLDGDPLGLRELELSLAWNATGPLPDWLDGTDDDDLDLELPTDKLLLQPAPAPNATEPKRDRESSPTELSVADQPLEAPPAIVVEPPLIAELVETGPTANSEPNKDLVSIDELLGLDDEAQESAPVAGQAALAPVPEPARDLNRPVVRPRFLSIDELIDARLCLLAAVADRLWAIPFDRIVSVTGPQTDDEAIDLFERQEGKRRRQPGVSIRFDSDVVLIVDRILGPRSLAWELLAANSNGPEWMVAQTNVAGETVGLLDWESLTGNSGKKGPTANAPSQQG